jgi:hypothetical protein
MWQQRIVWVSAIIRGQAGSEGSGSVARLHVALKKETAEGVAR